MIRHFFLDKTNTIIENTQQNFGLNPIMMIGYGNGLLRGLIHFNINDIKCLIEDGTFADLSKLNFYLKMTNCFSIDGIPYEKKITTGLDKYGKRAASCELMLFELPCEFDAGRGFDYISDIWVHDTRSFSKEGSTWFQSKTNIPWSEKYEKDFDYKKNPINAGIYDLKLLEEEYLKYKNGDKSIIIGTQKFDFGNEHLSINITDYVLKCLKSGYNYGLCLSFTPFYENKIMENTQVINFFTDHTNTFFHPYIEARYEEYVDDNRNNFYLGKNNRLYLYVNKDEIPTNLDEMPTCTIDGVNFDVYQAMKGVYYAYIPSNSISLEENMIYYDTWSNIILDGEKIDDVELEFVALKRNGNISIGDRNKLKKKIIPYISGINDCEEILNDEIREVDVEFREEYSSENYILVENAEYRIFVKDGEREIDVIDFQPLERGFINNFFLLYTMDLIPNTYFVDIKIKYGREVQYYKEVLKFNIINNVTERYQ